MKLEDHGCVLVSDDSQWRWVLTLTDKGSRLADSRPRRLQLVPKHRHERRPWRRYSDTLTERTDCEKVIVNRNGTVMAVLEADWTWVRRANARGGSDRKVWRLQSRGRLPRLLAAEINGKTYNEIRRILRRLETQ